VNTKDSVIINNLSKRKLSINVIKTKKRSVRPLFSTCSPYRRKMQL